MELTLRPYQEECVDILNNAEPGSYLVVLFTGAGKTVIFSHLKRLGRVLIISHREELVNQPKKYYDCSYGIERAEESSNGEEIVSASIQSLIRRLHKFKPDEFDIIITDEAHHAVAPSYQKVYQYFKPRLHVGFTATPNRADQLKLGQVFSKVIYEKDIKWGIHNGYLSDIRCMRAEIGYELKNVKMSMGDFKQDDLNDAVNIKECNKTIASIYKKHAIGQTLIFAASVEHAHNISKLIKGSEVISAATKNRSEILDQFRNGKIKVIINCMVLTEGTDLPMIRTVMMCRPTTNSSLYCQMVGRGTRLYKGKKELLLIDCVGSSRLPLCTAPILFGLDPEEAKEAGCDQMKITEMQKKIEDDKDKKIFNDPNSWKVNISLINLFEEKGDYDTHGVDYTICANKDMVCSLGQRTYLTLKAEDSTGRTNMKIIQNKRILACRDNLMMQEALDYVYEILSNDYQGARSLWNRQMIERWSDAPASNAQIAFVKSLYAENKDFIYTIKKLTKYQACCLINRKLQERLAEVSI